MYYYQILVSNLRNLPGVKLNTYIALFSVNITSVGLTRGVWCSIALRPHTAEGGAGILKAYSVNIKNYHVALSGHRRIDRIV